MRGVRGSRPGVLLGGLLGAACGGSAPDAHLGSLAQPIIYGADDRVELNAYPDQQLAERARQMVGALIPTRYLVPSGDDAFVIESPRLMDRVLLCPEESHAEQPSAAICSAMAAGSDAIVTAGHCLQSGISELAFVQNYALGDEYPRVSADQVRALARVLTLVDGNLATNPAQDLGVVKLAPGLNFPRVDLDATGTELQAEDRVVVVGTSEGLPLKVDDGARVFDATGAEHFEITSDTFGGGSGSVVFSDGGAVLGIVVGGNVDYEYDEGDACYARVRVSEPTLRAEIAVRSAVLKDALSAVLPAKATGGDAEHTGCGLSGTPTRPARGAELVVLAGVSYLCLRRRPRKACDG